MGNSKSKDSRKVTHVDEKLKYALRELQRVKDQNHAPHVSFNRVVLNFPKIQKTFHRMKESFNYFDKDKSGTLDYSELKQTMSRLHTNLNDDEIREVFDDVNVYHDGKISFKEFIVCIAVGYVLGMIPELEKGKPSNETKNLSPLKLRRTASTFYGNSKSISTAFELAIEMYRGFDEKGKGSINHHDMEAVMNRAQQQSPSKNMRKQRKNSKVGLPIGGPISDLLAEARWKEMDWDHDGEITFQEFIYTFVVWVQDTADDMDYEEDLEEEREVAKLGNSSRSFFAGSSRAINKK